METTQTQSVTQRPVDDGLQVTLAADIDVDGAEAARRQLLEVIQAAPPEARIWLELSGPSATAPALQLTLAARRSLCARDGFGGFGPLALAQLEPAGAANGAPAFSSVRSGS
ncbi:MAG: hypothetical protein JJT95_04625 [Pararhodobacter sp.]|nr:hypothetical protein [Pararhodobacter sp.]